MALVAIEPYPCYLAGMKQEQNFTSMNVSLPVAQKEFVELRVSTGGYGGVSDYIRDLIRRDEQEQARARLEARLLEALDSPASEMTAKDWKELRQNLVRRHSGRVKQWRLLDAMDRVEATEGIGRGLKSMRRDEGRPLKDAIRDLWIKHEAKLKAK